MNYIVYAQDSDPEIIKFLQTVGLEHNSIDDCESIDKFYHTVDEILISGYNVEIKFDGDYRELCVF